MIGQICQQYLIPIEPEKHLADHRSSIQIIEDMLGPEVFKCFEPVLLEFSKHVQQVPLNARGLSYEPNSVFVQGLLTVGYALRHAKRIALYTNKSLKSRKAAVEPTMLTIACAALLSNIAEPATRLTINCGKEQWDATRQNLFDWLRQRNGQAKNLAFKTVPECLKYPDYASMILCNLLPDSVKGLLGQMPELHLPGLLLRLVRRDFAEAAELHLPITLCIVNATRQVAEDLVYEAKCRKLQPHPPHLPVMLGMLLCTSFKDQWDMSRVSKIENKVILTEGKLYLVWPEGFQDLTVQAKQLWPASELDFTPHGLLGCLSDYQFIEYDRESDFTTLKLLHQGEIKAARLKNPERYFRKDSEWFKVFQEDCKKASAATKNVKVPEEGSNSGLQSPVYADDYTRGILQNRASVTPPAKPKPLTPSQNLSPFEKEVIKEKSVEIDRLRRSQDSLVGAPGLPENELDSHEEVNNSVSDLKKKSDLTRLFAVHSYGVNDEIYLADDNHSSAGNSVPLPRETGISEVSASQTTQKSGTVLEKEVVSSSTGTFRLPGIFGFKKLWGAFSNLFTKRNPKLADISSNTEKKPTFSKEDIQSFEEETAAVMQEKAFTAPVEEISEKVSENVVSTMPAPVKTKVDSVVNGKAKVSKETPSKASAFKEVVREPKKTGRTKKTTVATDKVDTEANKSTIKTTKSKRTTKTTQSSGNVKTKAENSQTSSAKETAKKGVSEGTTSTETKAGQTETKTTPTVSKTAKRRGRPPGTKNKENPTEKIAEKNSAPLKTSAPQKVSPKTASKKQSAKEKNSSAGKTDNPRKRTATQGA